MAERVIVVCDVCGEPATDRIGIRASNRNLQKDLCESHVAELMRGAHSPRRGRPRLLTAVAVLSPSKGRGRPSRAAHS